MSSNIAASGSSTIPTQTSSSASSLITSTGIGSGLDIGGIVSALTSSYGAAQTAQLDAQQSSLDGQVSAYGTFTSALDTLKSSLSGLLIPNQLAGYAATVADKTIASATTSSAAVAGQYSLLVNTLAASATLTSAALSSASAVVGSGTLTIAVGGSSADIPIDPSADTLGGIVAAINSAPKNPGVTASILTTSSGARLVLAGTSTGAANAITVTQSGGDGGLAALVYDPAHGNTQLAQTQAAADASFSINGFAATSPNNVVSGAITGLSLDLLAPSAANTPTTLSVTPDTSAAATAVGNFVTALNGAVGAVQTLTAYDPSTQTAGPLNGNATLESFQNQLQQILGQVVGGNAGAAKSLADLGITAKTDGSYALDNTKLSNALSSGVASVANLLGGTQGIATQLNALISGYTSTGGLLDSINQGLVSSLKSVAQQQTALQAQLATYSATLTAEYNAMDTAVAKLKETQQYLTAEFNPSSSSTSSSSAGSSLGSGTVSF